MELLSWMLEAHEKKMLALGCRTWLYLASSCEGLEYKSMLLHALFKSKLAYWSTQPFCLKMSTIMQLIAIISTSS